MGIARRSSRGAGILTEPVRPESRVSIAATSAPYRWSIPYAVVWLVVLVAVEAIVRLGVHTGLFMPAPSLVAASLVEMVRDGTLPRHLASTLARIGGGLLIGVTAGVVLGLAAGTSQRMRRIIDPIVAALHPIPRLAFFPLLIIMFGIGEASKIAAVSLGAFFPMFLNTVAGVRGMNPVHVELGRNYGADARQMFVHVLVPGAMPLMLIGLRLAANTAFHGTIGVEMVGSRTGIGAMLWLSWQTFRIDRLYAILVVIAVIGILLAALIRWTSRRTAPWLEDKPLRT